jgi:hypothetical protein
LRLLLLVVGWLLLLTCFTVLWLLQLWVCAGFKPERQYIWRIYEDEGGYAGELFVQCPQPTLRAGRHGWGQV